MRLYTAFVVLSLFSAPIAHALDDENTRPSLRGIKGVKVIVEALPTDAERNGLTKSAIQTDIELKLRQAGIPVLNTGDADLFVSVSILADRDIAIWPFMITVGLGQDGALVRDSSISLPLVVTWEVSSFGHVGKQNLRSVRDNVKDHVDSFINAYLVMNPKK